MGYLVLTYDPSKYLIHVFFMIDMNRACTTLDCKVWVRVKSLSLQSVYYVLNLETVGHRKHYIRNLMNNFFFYLFSCSISHTHYLLMTRDTRCIMFSLDEP